MAAHQPRPIAATPILVAMVIGAAVGWIIGPEGGFTEGELNSVQRRVALSPNVLRVETAALAAAFLLTLRNH